MRRRSLPCLAAAVLLLAGCATAYRGPGDDTTAAELRRTCGATAVEGVPFVAQVGREECGSAALAMILGYWRIDASEADVRAACPSAPEVGTAATTLRDHSRAKGLSAWVIRGEFADLEHELARGRPVLVGLLQSWSDATWSHYAVVVGISRANDCVVTIDPARGWQKYALGGFLDEWEPAGRLAMVFLRPSTGAIAAAAEVNSSENPP
ncbi:MAG: C39 family peptidase [Planctomycetes bacterium]|nr:C39 family peptidase [Planctomycetota bacterium]